jgi:hypothetical protein
MPALDGLRPEDFAEPPTPVFCASDGNYPKRERADTIGVEKNREKSTFFDTTQNNLF